ncbi:hypothetical protein B0H19DRAFT_715494 [Mycena capillaripes]|nr:hypothetical protein B0H19DRAFT_715494 [Mycena capillaripes]
MQPRASAARPSANAAEPVVRLLAGLHPPQRRGNIFVMLRATHRGGFRGSTCAATRVAPADVARHEVHLRVGERDGTTTGRSAARHRRAYTGVPTGARGYARYAPTCDWTSPIAIGTAVRRVPDMCAPDVANVVCRRCG